MVVCEDFGLEGRLDRGPSSSIGTSEFVNMADEVARRRELRRRRILENAEERKKKIFGTTKVNESKEPTGE